MKHYVIATAIVLSVFFFTLMDASPWITVGFVGIFTTMLVFHCDRQDERQNALEERIDEMGWAEEQVARLQKGGLIGAGPGEENAEDLMSAWDIMSNDLKALTTPRRTGWVVAWIDSSGREFSQTVYATTQHEAYEVALDCYAERRNVSPFRYDGVYVFRLYREETVLPSIHQSIRSHNPPEADGMPTPADFAAQMEYLTAYQGGKKFKQP
jgi:hypothetical protein